MYNVTSESRDLNLCRSSEQAFHDRSVKTIERFRVNGKCEVMELQVKAAMIMIR